MTATASAVPLRLAVVGAGHIGLRHAKLLQHSAACTLASLVDPQPGVDVLAHRLGVPLWRDLATMLRQARPDGVIVATPNALHVEQALQCVAAGVPVLVEKPVADSLDDAHRLGEAVHAAGVPVLVGHHRRHSAILEAARRVIDAGRLGRLVAVTGSATFRKPDAYFGQAPWRCQAGGGPILINMIHEVDDLRALVGDIVEVQAMASSAARGFAVEDTVAIALRFANGALGSFMLSDAAASPRSWEQTSGEDPAYDHHADEDCYVIAGERGCLQMPTLRLREYRGEASWYEPLATERLARHQADPLQRQLEHFCAMIRGECAPRVGVDDAARTLAATLAIAEAARSGRAVRPG